MIFHKKFFYRIREKLNQDYKTITSGTNKIIDENFFIIDSNNLEKIESKMYGFSVSKKGILTDNYYKNIGRYEEPEPQGAFIMVRKIMNEIIIRQDYFGSYGLYIYENKNTEFFAISNSFLLLEEYLINKQNMTLNKDFSDNLIISDLCTYSIQETLIKQISIIPPNGYIIINIKTKKFLINYIDYKENSVPIESKKGMEILDKWMDKWCYIIRSLKKQANNFSTELSGGFDTRAILSIFLCSGIELNTISIFSKKDNLHGHDEDFQIATNISIKYGFKLNNLFFNTKSSKFSTRDSILLSMYTKLGFNKELYFQTKFYEEPIFNFGGGGGETIRGYPAEPIDKYIEIISSDKRQIKSNFQRFFNSSVNLCNRSIELLNKLKKYDNNYQLAVDFYTKGFIKHHFGKSTVENFLANKYIIQPLIDPDIKIIKFGISEKSYQDLYALILVRFAHDLISFPFQGKREINPDCIKKAEKLNNKSNPYKIKKDYNNNFYIDYIRTNSMKSSKNINNNIEEYLNNIFKTSEFRKSINQLYNKDVYKIAKEYSIKSKFFRLKHFYGLFGIKKIYEDLKLNKKCKY